MRFVVDAVVRAPLDDVWRWWTDYGVPGAETEVSHGLGRTRRRVVAASENRVVLEERLPLGRRSPTLVRHEIERFEADHRLREHAGRPFPFDAWWLFEALPTGETRIRRVVRVVGGVSEILARLARPLVRRLVERDLLHHVGQFEAERAAA